MTNTTNTTAMADAPIWASILVEIREADADENRAMDAIRAAGITWDDGEIEIEDAEIDAPDDVVGFWASGLFYVPQTMMDELEEEGSIEETIDVFGGMGQIMVEAEMP